MELPDMNQARKIVDDWEKAIWRALYNGETSLDKQLAIISERLELKSMPWLKNDIKKRGYLFQLEDQYYDRVYRQVHELDEEEDWSLIGL